MQEKILNYLIKLCSYFYENIINHLAEGGWPGVTKGVFCRCFKCLCE